GSAGSHQAFAVREAEATGLRAETNSAPFEDALIHPQVHVNGSAPGKRADYFARTIHIRIDGEGIDGNRRGGRGGGKLGGLRQDRRKNAFRPKQAERSRDYQTKNLTRVDRLGHRSRLLTLGFKSAGYKRWAKILPRVPFGD